MACATGAVQQCPRSEHTAVCAGPHNGETGRAADASHGSEIGGDEPENNTRRGTSCWDIVSQNVDTARFFGGIFVDFDVKASRRRYGAERADPPTPGVSGEGGGTPRRRNRAERRSDAVETRRQKCFRPACEL